MSDNNFYSIADKDNVVLADTELIVPFDQAHEIDDILKISHSTRILVQQVVVDGYSLQKENAIDMNRECRDVEVSNCRLVSGKQNALTVKGGCENIRIIHTEIVPGHGHCDIELGNWSDQSDKRTTGVVLKNVWRTDGEPLRLRVGNADYPKIVDCEVDYLWFQSFLLKAYLFLKKHKIVK